MLAQPGQRLGKIVHAWALGGSITGTPRLCKRLGPQDIRDRGLDGRDCTHASGSINFWACWAGFDIAGSSQLTLLAGEQAGALKRYEILVPRKMQASMPARAPLVRPLWPGSFGSLGSERR